MSKVTTHPPQVWGPVKKEEYNGVWVFVECFDGGASEVSLQLLTPAKKIAEK